ncbi:hypothetical protein ACFCX4_26680 [Kitasatospora sp. NPDC056327]|uniref:hypothetical protein n=1 Tax=Kitasatospora sp. NPDC056327 TaxID=3345785 RepID=UPI0035DC2F93
MSPAPAAPVPPAAPPAAPVPPAEPPWATAPPFPPSGAPPAGPPPVTAVTPAGPGTPATPEHLHHQAGPVPGDATRYLCAAAWLDRGFRARLLGELVEHSYRVPAPSPGTDLVRVLHEALTARRWEAWTGALCLLVLVLASPVLGVPAVILALTVVALLGLFRGTAAARPDHRLGLEAEHLDVARSAPRGRPRRTGTSVLVRLVQAVAVLAVARLALYAYVEIWYWRTFGFVPDESYLEHGWATLLDPTAFWYLLRDEGATALPAVVLLWLVAAALRFRIRRRLAAFADPGRGALPPPEPKGARAARLYARLRDQQSGPELLYRRQAPLTGLGTAGRSWRMTFELRPSAKRAAGGRAPDPIDAAVLYHAVAARVRALAQDPGYPEDPLGGLTVTDRVFRPSLRHDPPQQWLGAMSGRSGTQVLLEPAWADLLSRTGHERLRHYLAIRVGSWHEEVVVTVLVRATTRGGLLYLEWLPYALGPVAHAYHVVDLLGHRSASGHALNALGWSARHLVADIATAVGELREARESRSRAARIGSRYRHLRRAGYAVDFAPRLSVRELGASDEFQNIFQAHDVDRFLNTVTQRVFSAVGEELRARGYDSAAFERQAQGITNVNNGGVQVVGSTVHGPVAGGAGADVNLGNGQGA